MPQSTLTGPASRECTLLRLTVQSAMPRETAFKHTLRADIDGFSLHAAVRCSADDRPALGQLCRHITRPALAN